MAPPTNLAPAPTATSGWTDTAVSVRLRRGANGTVRVDGMLCSAPLWVRWDADAGTLWLVGSGASPVGEDHIRLRIDVGPGVAVAVRSVAATIVYAATGAGTRWDTELCVAEGAVVDWRPDPVIVTERARHVATTTVQAASDATVVLDEALVLGRTGEAAGAVCSTLSVERDGVPVLLTSVDSSLPGWAGPGGTAGRSVVAQRLHLGPFEAGDPPPARPTGAVLEPAPGCRLAVTAAPDLADALGVVDGLLPVESGPGDLSGF